MTKFYSVTTPIKTRHKRTWFRQVGAGFRARPGQSCAHKIKLDATPLNGELLVFALKDEAGPPPRDNEGLPEEMWVTIPANGTDDRVRFTAIGIAFAAKQGRIEYSTAASIQLRCMGQLVLFERQEGEDA